MNIERYLFKEEKFILMSKGIAIRTILYLLLGVLVVAILVYLVYTYTTGPSMDIQDCRSRVTNWCNSCMIAGWLDGFGTKTDTSDIYTCIEAYFATDTLELGSIDCNSMYGTDGDTKTFCEDFI